MSVQRDAILLPVLALVLLTALVWLFMYTTRLLYIHRRRIRPQSLADAAAARERLAPVSAPADNLRNLFEVPVLFYALAALLYARGIVHAADLWLAWAFVALRWAHSLIHCTYNRVVHRFMVYVLGCVALGAAWVRLGMEVGSTLVNP